MPNKFPLVQKLGIIKQPFIKFIQQPFTNFIEGDKFWKLLTVVVAVSTPFVTNYFSEQNYYDQVLEKYNSNLKDFLVSNKMISLKKENEDLEQTIQAIEKPSSSDKSPLLSIPRNKLTEESYITSEMALADIISPKTESIKKKYLQYLTRQRDINKSKITQTQYLINTATVNTLVTLGENDAPFRLIGLQLFKRNVKRRDLFINTLRIAQLGIKDPLTEEIKNKEFLNGIAIGGYSPSDRNLLDLWNINLSLANLNNSQFRSVNLNRANFSNSELKGAIFSDSQVKSEFPWYIMVARSLKFNTGDDDANYVTNFKQVKMQQARLICSDFEGADFTKADMTSVIARSAFKRNCNNGHGTSFKNSRFVGTNLTNANLTNTNLTNADLTNANLTNANLTDAKGIGLEQLQKVKSQLCNTKVPNKGKTITAFVNCKDANLTNVDLTNVNLTDIDLTNADLTNAKGIDLEKLQKVTSKLCNTTVPNKGKTIKAFVNCKDADLKKKDLSNAKLIGKVNFTNANLTDTKGISLNQLKKNNAILCHTTLWHKSVNNDNCPSK
jgi:uncharacterized protein YjbI with pentapeptide repeats